VESSGDVQHGCGLTAVGWQERKNRRTQSASTLEICAFEVYTLARSAARAVVFDSGERDVVEIPFVRSHL
jgi:hypothetical protein